MVGAVLLSAPVLGFSASTASADSFGVEVRTPAGTTGFKTSGLRNIELVAPWFEVENKQNQTSATVMIDPDTGDLLPGTLTILAPGATYSGSIDAGKTGSVTWVL
ncbi:hypothetical protein [Streptomyces sp. NPDC058629]|uniref:hypothetical protein n=1 Tax=Streptomyces sp. NPDC058629 TaxID=3346565 RepID=UPI003664ECEE